MITKDFIITNIIAYCVSFIGCLLACSSAIGQLDYNLSSQAANSEYRKSFIVVDLGINRSPYSTSLDEDTLNFKHQMLANGLNANASLLFLRNDDTEVFFGFDWNFQFDSFLAKERLDYFDQRKIFNAYSYSAGGNIGFEAVRDDVDIELVFKGGVVFNTYVQQLVDSENYQVINSSPLGYYGALQLNIVGLRGNGVFFGVRHQWRESFESNFNVIYSIEGYELNIPTNRTIWKMGIRFGL